MWVVALDPLRKSSKHRYMVTHQVDSNLPLTTKQKWRFCTWASYRNFVLMSTGGLNQRDVSPCSLDLSQNQNGVSSHFLEPRLQLKKFLLNWFPVRCLHPLPHTLDFAAPAEQHLSHHVHHLAGVAQLGPVTGAIRKWRPQIYRNFDPFPLVRICYWSAV